MDEGKEEVCCIVEGVRVGSGVYYEMAPIRGVCVYVYIAVKRACTGAFLPYGARRMLFAIFKSQ